MNYARSTAVVVEARSASDRQGGSGFVLKRAGPYAIVATNRHVVVEDSGRPFSDFRILTASGVPGSALLLFVEPDVNVDFALLAIRDDHNALAQEVQVAERADVGSYVVCVGSPLESPLMSFDGHLTWVSGQEGLFAADCVGERGSSGGPVFDANNKVVGIIARGIRFPSTGREEIGGSLLSRYMKRLSIHATNVAADRVWQDSTIAVAAGDQVQILASGSWHCGFGCGHVSAAGRTGYATRSYDARFPHAALLVRVTGSERTDCVCKASPAAMDRSAAVASFAADRRGTLELRPNDNDYGNNVGRMSVLVVVKRNGS
ncbi:MAG: serine protease [Myxococcota bacterium]|nr:serine protease [Myxococcota bacterium]